MNRMIYIEGRKYSDSRVKPFGYWINADHISYVTGKSEFKGCMIKVLDRESHIETDESFDDVMAKVRNT